MKPAGPDQPHLKVLKVISSELLLGSVRNPGGQAQHQKPGKRLRLLPGFRKGRGEAFSHYILVSLTIPWSILEQAAITFRPFGKMMWLGSSQQESNKKNRAQGTRWVFFLLTS